VVARLPCSNTVGTGPCTAIRRVELRSASQMEEGERIEVAIRGGPLPALHRDLCTLQETQAVAGSDRNVPPLEAVRPGWDDRKWARFALKATSFVALAIIIFNAGTAQEGEAALQFGHVRLGQFVFLRCHGGILPLSPFILHCGRSHHKRIGDML
jgi:hypothetical protein